jgi:hypothetical protein
MTAEPDPRAQSARPDGPTPDGPSKAATETDSSIRTPDRDESATERPTETVSEPVEEPTEAPDDTETTELMPKFTRDQNAQVTPPRARRTPSTPPPPFPPPVMPPYPRPSTVRPPRNPVPPPRPWLAAAQPPARSPVQPNQSYAAVGAAERVESDVKVALHKGSDALTLSKVLAGGMAAATSAVFGSYFGTFGTVGGAAVGSVATTVVTRLFQRSIERTQNTVVSTVKHVVGTDDDPDRSVPVAGAKPVSTGSKSLNDVATVRMSPQQVAEAKSRGRRSVKMLLFGTLMIFLLALALVTGIEWAKGSPLSGGGNGTSIERVLQPHAVPPTPTSDRQAPSDGDLSDSTEPSDDDSSDDDSSGHHHHRHDSDSDSNSSDSNSPDDSTERAQPSSGGLLGGLVR